MAKIEIDPDQLLDMLREDWTERDIAEELNLDEDDAAEIFGVEKRDEDEIAELEDRIAELEEENRILRGNID